MSRTLGKDLREVSDQVVQMVNFIKTKPVKSRLFEQICTNRESQHRRLLLHTDVRWLSRGKVLTHVHELQQEIITFFEAIKQSHFCNLHRCEIWITRLQYLASIFKHLNILNSNMQGQEENILTSTDKIKAFQRKLQIWKRTAMEGSLEMFPLVSNNCKTEILPMIVEHLSTLEENLSYYFPLINTAQYDLIKNPFVETAIYYSLTLTEKEELTAV